MSAYHDLALETLSEQVILLERERDAYRLLALRAVAYAHRLQVSLDDGRRRHIIRDRDAVTAVTT